MEAEGQWVAWIKSTEMWSTGGEWLSATFAINGKTLLLGGSLGTVIRLQDKSKPERVHSGVFAEITVLAGRDQAFVAGFKRGHLAWGDFPEPKRWFSTLSVPFYRRVEAMSGSFDFGGDLGVWGVADPKTQRINLKKNRYGDILTSCKLDEGKLIFAGAGHIGLISADGSSTFESVPHIITALEVEAETVWLGCADGRVWRAERKQLIAGRFKPSTWQMVGAPLKQIPVSFSHQHGNQRVAGCNGLVSTWRAGHWQDEQVFGDKRIYPRSAGDHLQRLLLAGSREFLAEWSDQMLRLPRVPDSIRTISCYGVIDGDLWVGRPARYCIAIK